MAKKREKMTELINKNEYEPFSHLGSLPSIEYESFGNFLMQEGVGALVEEIPAKLVPSKRSRAAKVHNLSEKVG